MLGANINPETSEIENLNKKINETKDVSEKATFAQLLLAKVNSLIERHEDKSLSCVAVLNLRKRTAELIIRLRRRPRASPVEECDNLASVDVTECPWFDNRWMNPTKPRTKVSWRRRVTYRYHGQRPWGSIKTKRLAN